jgi:chemosensory pili system protein ChpA (sensor histidine kinase/response regulator)
MVGATEIGDFSWRFEELLNKLIEGRASYSPAIGEAVELAIDALLPLKARLLGENPALDKDGIDSLTSFARQLSGGGQPDIHSLRNSLPDLTVEDATGITAPQASPDKAEFEDILSGGDIDPTLKQLMLGEIRGQLAEMESFVSALMTGSQQAVSSNLVRAIHTLAGTLALAPLGQEVDAARALEHYLDNRLKSDQPVTSAASHTMQTCLHRFHQRLAVLEDGNPASYPLNDSELIRELSGLAEHEDSARTADAAATADTAPSEPRLPAEDARGEALQQATETPAQESEEPESGAIVIEEGSIISIFLEEANEVLERCDTLLNTWRDKLSDRKLVQNLQREIHTFKGGARMAGLEDMGTFSHAMENLLENIASKRMEATVAAVQALEEGCDKLNLWVEQVQSGRLPQTADALDRFEKRVSALRLPDAGEPAEFEDLSEAPQKPAGAEVTDLDEEKEQAAKESAEAATAATPRRKSRFTKRKAVKPAARKPDLREDPARQFQEIPDRPASAAEDAAPGAQIRVAAELMDKLVNYAGEISIYRSRMEQQLGFVRHNLKEVDVTVDRLKEQLRKMDIESEAQMMSRYQSAATKGSSEFDPLELDRFSNMQQLSRALSESVSDLLNLHDMLDDSVRQAESLLTQQSRVSSEMQEGLMQTRMTPFGSAAPRLRRVVRAAAAETGKKARLQLRMAGSNDQLDRNVLERITAPLEHMLRNAIAHGIELPKVRRKLKKPEEGNITVTVEAEATEFVIRVQDDGAGVDVDAVRKRAIERGLIGKDEEVSEHRLVQFIRDSGFSTANTVTGLAGRGVGMDVVNSEIKQIGGSMEIDTESGQGTRFTIRIPFSLAVMQAIGVSVGDRPFQIPLNSVAGVARMTPSEYSDLLRSESPSYEFAGEAFPLLELEPLLGAPSLPLDSDNVSLLMIRSGEHKAAFRVADLQGHQEVVIKPVGPQVSSIPGILGGTIAADGQVMIILDMGPLIRRGLETAVQPVEPKAVVKEETRQPLVMVVDDSITMRKVTSRVLENHSIEVLTAQDGVDAVEKLHDRVPDLMLLDIEMPRMDGYELLEHVRADARLRHVPIVMITSRAGQKHRRKARKAGANDYLTKPYQEVELVEKVSEMLDVELIPRRSE